jgi:hypothetical protein
MARKFSHENVFPVIARLITTIHQATQTIVSHDELVEAMLNDGQGMALTASACDADDEKKSAKWWASNMVQWFSQRITEDDSEYTNRYERTKIDGAWAYRPIS